MRTSTLLLTLLATAAFACGSKKKDDAPAATKPTPGPGTAAEPAPPPPPTLTAKPIAVDPATFTAVDLAAVPALADVAAVAPPGATVTPDDPSFDDQKVHGAVIAAGDFRLHVWHGTVGGERTTVPMKAKMLDDKAVYTETKSEPTLVEYTLESGGAKTFGYFQPIEGWTTNGDQLLCGTAAPVASAEALAPYRAACGQIKKK